MSADDLKKELISYINNTNDEELLSLLKEDLVFYGKTGVQKDITDDLSEEQFAELKQLMEEDSFKDTESLEDFQKATEKWRNATKTSEKQHGKEV